MKTAFVPFQILCIRVEIVVLVGNLELFAYNSNVAHPYRIGSSTSTESSILWLSPSRCKRIDLKHDNADDVSRFLSRLDLSSYVKQSISSKSIELIRLAKTRNRSPS